VSVYRERFYPSADGLQLYYRDYDGDARKTPVLCLPGLTRNSRDFETIAAHIAGTRRVLAADLRGRGRSAYDPDWRHYAVAIETADTARLLEDAGVERVIVLGTSRGGLVGMALASLPGVVAAMILNDIGAELDAAGLDRIYDATGREESYDSWEAAAASLKQSYGAAFPDVSDAQWLGSARARFRALEDRIVPDYDLKLGDATRTGGTTRRGSASLWPLYDQLLSRPLLLLRGENSDLLSDETVRKMQERKADLVTVTVPGRGHPPFLDEPEAVAAIDGFLADLP
jgi:pimeloyl-ACP methyl ester carboxylesterase